MTRWNDSNLTLLRILSDVLSGAELAGLFGTTTKAIYLARCKFGIAKPVHHYTDAEISFVAGKYAQGVTARKIACELSLTITQVETLIHKLQLPSGSTRLWSLHERFLNLTEKTESGCWLWTGATSQKGYGHIRNKGRSVAATHVALSTIGVPVPPGYDACHKCDNPRCVNPAHLFVGSRKENMQDARAKGRVPHGPRAEWIKVSQRGPVPSAHQNAVQSGLVGRTQ